MATSLGNRTPGRILHWLAAVVRSLGRPGRFASECHIQGRIWSRLVLWIRSSHKMRRPQQLRPQGEAAAALAGSGIGSGIDFDLAGSNLCARC